MKRIFILLVFTSFTLGGFSQTKSKSEVVYANRDQASNTTTIYMQLIGDESINSLEVKLKLILGEDNKFYIKDKYEIEIYDQISSDIGSFRNFPDALNYLSDKGFVIENYSGVIFHENIRHTFILSRTSYNK